MPLDHTTIGPSRFPAPLPRPSEGDEIKNRLAKVELTLAAANSRLAGLPNGAQLLIWAAAMVFAGVLMGFGAALLR